MPSYPGHPERCPGLSSFRRFAALGILLLTLLACQRFAPDQLARYQSGAITLGELDAHFLTLPAKNRTPAEGQEVAAWVEKALEEVFVAKVIGNETDLAALGADSDYQKYFADVQRSILATEYLKRRNARFDVSLDEARALFAEHEKEIRQPERRVFRHLFLAATGDAEAIRKRLEDLRHQVVAGASFEELIRQHSQAADAALGGEVGPVDRAALPPKLAELIFGLPLAGLSEVSCQKSGCHLFQVTQVLPAIEPQFDLVRDQLIQRLAEQKRRQWRLELLRQQAAARGVELPDWIAGGPVPELTVDSILISLPEESLIVRDLQPALRSRATLAEAVQQWLGSRLFSAALTQELPPTELAALIDRLRRDQGFTRLRARALQAELRRLPEATLREFFERSASRYMTEPAVELTLYAWPLAGLESSRAFKAALDQGQSRDQALARHGRQAKVETLPQKTLRQLALENPELSLALAEPPQEGKAFGPIRDRDRLLVVVFEVVVPERRQSFLEARPQVERDYLGEKRADIERIWLDGLRRHHKLEINHEAVAAFGQRLSASLAAGKPAETP